MRGSPLAEGSPDPVRAAVVAALLLAGLSPLWPALAAGVPALAALVAVLGIERVRRAGAEGRPWPTPARIAAGAGALGIGAVLALLLGMAPPIARFGPLAVSAALFTLLLGTADRPGGAA